MLNLFQPPVREPLTRLFERPTLGKGGGGGFDIASLFAGGIPGVAVDTLNSSKLYQDSARTTFVAAIGDPIGGPLDVTGNAKHPVQATSANRPLWDGSGVRYDGSNDGWATPSIDFSGTDKITVMYGVLKNADPSTMMYIELTANAATTDGSFFVASNGAQHQAALRGTALVFESYGLLVGFYRQSNIDICIHEFDLAGAGIADEIAVQINGSVVTPNNASGTAAGSGTFANAAVYFGRRGGASLPLNGTLFRPIVIGRLLTADEKAAAAAWINEAVNTKGANSHTPTVFADSRPPVTQGAYQLTSVFGHADYTTDATVIDIEVENDIFDIFSAYCGVGVWVNNAFVRDLAPNALGSSRHRIYLAAGTKTVSFVNGLQSRPNVALPVKGTFVKKVYADKPLTPITPSPNMPIVIYTDSIGSGGNATPTSQNAWPLRVRAATTRSVAVEGWGYRALYDDAATGAQQDVLAALLASYFPVGVTGNLLLTPGRNDYGIAGKWGHAAFGAAYGAVMDKFHALRPLVTINCITPLLSTVETANGFGSTLGDYRTAISTEVSSRSGFATLIDGTAIMTTGSLADGVHPTTAGHGLYATYVISALGL